MEGFVTVWDCKWIMSKDEWKRFKRWIETEPGIRLETGRRAWPIETVAKFFNVIHKPWPGGDNVA